LFRYLIITLQKSPSICFWRHSWFVPDSSKLDWTHLSYHRGLLCNSLGTPDLPKLSVIWIWRGPWNRKFSAPSGPSSKLENCIHPPIIGLNQGFVRISIKFSNPLMSSVSRSSVCVVLFFKPILWPDHRMGRGMLQIGPKLPLETYFNLTGEPKLPCSEGLQVLINILWTQSPSDVYNDSNWGLHFTSPSLGQLIQGKQRGKVWDWTYTRWLKLQGQTLESREDGECRHLDFERVSLHVYVEHNNKLEKVFRDVTSEAWPWLKLLWSINFA